MTDTSKEAVERVICAPIIRMVDRGGQPTLDGCAALIDTARALAAERDTLAKQLAEARNAALEEAALWAESEGLFRTRDEIRALKSTSAEGEG